MASRLLLKFVEIIQPDYLQNCLSKSGLECNAFNQTIYKIVYQNQGWNATHSTRLFTKLFIEIRVECVEVFAVQVIQNKAKSFAEPLIVYNFTFA